MLGELAFARAIVNEVHERGISICEATQAVRDEFVRQGFPDILVQKLATNFANRAALRQGAVVNPAILFALNKGVSICLASGDPGAFEVTSGLADDIRGNVDRYITLGRLDAIFVIYGTEEDAEALNTRFRQMRLRSEILRVTSIPWFRGYRAADVSRRAIDSLLTSPDRLAALDRLVADYWTADLSKEQQSLKGSSVILGPGVVVNDLAATGHLKAFVGVDFHGFQKTDAVNTYIDRMLSTQQVRASLDTVYRCEGLYDVLFEVWCEGIQELDDVTDRLALADLWGSLGPEIHTETHLVARVVEDSLPVAGAVVIRVLGSPTWPFIADIEEEYIRGLSERLRESYANELTNEQRLFLISFVAEFEHFGVELLAQRDLNEMQAARDAFLEGYIEHSLPRISNSVVSMARVVERICGQSLRRTLDILYKGRLGLAQQQYQLPLAAPGRMTLGGFVRAFGAIAADERYRVLGITFPEYFLNLLGTFSVQRNRFAHGQPFDEFEEDFGLAARAARLAFLSGIEIALWLQEHVLVGPEDISIDDAAELILHVREDKTQIEVALSALQTELIRDRKVLVGKLSELQTELDTRDRDMFESLVAELTRMSVTGAASRRREGKWRAIAKGLSEDKKDEILHYVDKGQEAQVAGLLDRLGDVAENVTLGVIGNAIYDLLIMVSVHGLPPLISYISRMLHG